MDALNAANYQNELEGFAHFDWNSPSTINSYTYADTGIDRTVATLEFLLHYSAYPANTNPAMRKSRSTRSNFEHMARATYPITAGVITCTAATLTLDFTSVMSLNGQTIGPVGAADYNCRLMPKELQKLPSKIQLQG